MRILAGKDPRRCRMYEFRANGEKCTFSFCVAPKVRPFYGHRITDLKPTIPKPKCELKYLFFFSIFFSQRIWLMKALRFIGRSIRGRTASWVEKLWRIIYLHARLSGITKKWLNCECTLLRKKVNGRHFLVFYF